MRYGLGLDRHKSATYRATKFCPLQCNEAQSGAFSSQEAPLGRTAWCHLASHHPNLPQASPGVIKGHKKKPFFNQPGGPKLATAGSKCAKNTCFGI